MPNKNKTACKRRIRSQRSQRRRYRTARNGGRSPLLFSREASDTRRRSNVPAKFWLSPRRWNAERKTRNLANEIATQRAAAKDATRNAATTHAAIDAMVKQLREKQRIALEITRINQLISLVTIEQQGDPRVAKMVANRNSLMAQLKQLNTASNSAVYSEIPAPTNEVYL